MCFCRISAFKAVQTGVIPCVFSRRTTGTRQNSASQILYCTLMFMASAALCREKRANSGSKTCQFRIFRLGLTFVRVGVTVVWFTFFVFSEICFYRISSFKAVQTELIRYELQGELRGEKGSKRHSTLNPPSQAQQDTFVFLRMRTVKRSPTGRRRPLKTTATGRN